jgi:hypothetical protein
MKQFSTGTGVAVLGVCILAATVVATQRGGSEAFAQVTGGERRIVAQGVYYGGSPGIGDGFGNGDAHWAYRVWSDNTTEVRFLGATFTAFDYWAQTWTISVQKSPAIVSPWGVVDTGTGAFLAADVDRSRQVDAGDISSVLLDFSASTDETPPPPIDCTINAPR